MPTILSGVSEEERDVVDDAGAVGYLENRSAKKAC